MAAMSPVNEAARGAGTARAAGSRALPQERTKLVDKVTQSPRRRRSSARKPGDVTPAVSPRLIEEASRIFLALGITAADLQLRAKPGSAFAELADALDARASAP